MAQKSPIRWQKTEIHRLKTTVLKAPMKTTIIIDCNLLNTSSTVTLLESYMQHQAHKPNSNQTYWAAKKVIMFRTIVEIKYLPLNSR